MSRFLTALHCSRLRPAAIELLDRDALAMTADLPRAPHGDLAACLWVLFEGMTEEEVDEDACLLGELAEEVGAGEVMLAQTPDAIAALWQPRHRIGEIVLEATPFRDVDLTFPRDRWREVLEVVKETGRRVGFETVVFGHTGDGNFHVNVLRRDLDEAFWQGPVLDGIEAIYRATVAMGGTLSGEHGVGCMQQRFMSQAMPPAKLALMRAIKQAFDPRGILNPGKIFPET